MPSREVDINRIKQSVLNRLYGHSPLPELVGLDGAIESVFSLLNRAVQDSESNSALLIGPRGSGKSAILNRTLDMVDTKALENKRQYHVVKLNGFIHTTDRIALRDIARQLLVEQDLDNILIGSFADAFTYILNLLRQTSLESDEDSAAAASTPPVLFILDEFDLLAQHPKQSLLYTLFDIAQSQQTPIAVLGVTSRIDVMDLLEKRVKSRFSHRQIYVQYPQKLDDFLRVARVALHVTDVDDSFTNKFNRRVNEILKTDQVARHITSIYDLNKDIRQLLRLFVLAACKLTSEDPLLQLCHVQESIKIDMASAKMQILSKISLLEISLLIAMKSLVQGGSSKYNFEMVYNEYKTFMSRHLMAVAAGGAMKVYKKPVALKAFETLVELEIVRPLVTTAAVAADGNGTYARNDLLAGGQTHGARAPKEYRMVQMMLEPGQVVDLVSDRTDLPTAIRRWAQ